MVYLVWAAKQSSSLVRIDNSYRKKLDIKLIAPGQHLEVWRWLSLKMHEIPGFRGQVLAEVQILLLLDCKLSAASWHAQILAALAVYCRTFSRAQGRENH